MGGIFCQFVLVLYIVASVNCSKEAEISDRPGNAYLLERYTEAELKKYMV